MSTGLKDLLLQGFPIQKDILLPWKTPFGTLSTLGNAAQKEWNRWQQDRDGRYFENKKIRLEWNKIQVPGIPSIVVANLEYDRPDRLFKKVNLYFSNRNDLEMELTQQLGEVFIHRTEYEDRDGINENIQHQWILRSPDSIKKVTFLLDSEFRIEYSEVD